MSSTSSSTKKRVHEEDENLIPQPKKKKSKKVLPFPVDKYRAVDKKVVNLIHKILDQEKDHLSSTELQMITECNGAREDLLKHLLDEGEFNPTIIEVVSSMPIETIYEILSSSADDKKFVQISLSMLIHVLFFADKGTMWVSNACVQNVLGNDYKVEFENIRKKYLILEDLLNGVSNHWSEHGPLSHMLHSSIPIVQDMLLNRLVRYFSTYDGDAQFDISFIINSVLWGIDKSVLNELTQLISRGVFIVSYVPMRVRTPSKDSNRPQNTPSQNMSALGMKLNTFSSRISVYRNNTFKKLTELVHNFDYGSKDASSSSPPPPSLSDSVNTFVRLYTNYDIFLKVISDWKMPYGFFKKTFDVLYSKGLMTLSVSEYTLKKELVTFLRALKEREILIYKMEKRDIICILKKSLFGFNFRCLKQLLPLFKHFLKIEEVKHITRFVFRDYSLMCKTQKDLQSFPAIQSASLFMEEFPWLAKTWIDDDDDEGGKGHTLLTFAIVHRYPLISQLISHPILKSLVNTTCRDKHFTPLMHLANTSIMYQCNTLLCLIINGAKPEFINKFNENVLHIAIENVNYGVITELRGTLSSEQIEKMVNVRRMMDNTTPLMIALARENIVLAQLFDGLYKPKIKVRFGSSKRLRIPEFVLLKGLKESVAYLETRNISYDINIIKDAVMDNSLFEEEYEIAAAGLRGNNCDPEADEKTMNTWNFFTKNSTKWASSIFQKNRQKFVKIVDGMNRTYEDSECAICLDSLDGDLPSGRTTCGHCFHNVCWLSLIRMSGPNNGSRARGGGIKCPSCRQVTCLGKRLGVADYDIETEEERDTKNVVPSVEEGRREWRKIGVDRYEFLVGGVWTNEIKL
nr:MAG: RING finger-containing protein [White spot syndrome virus]